MTAELRYGETDILQNGNGAILNLKLLRLTSPFASTVKRLR
jgi:hypothetical protein